MVKNEPSNRAILVGKGCFNAVYPVITPMTLLESVFLGILQGITEFLPISSTGHLILLRSFLDMETAGTLAFDAILHLATATAVLWYFRKDFWVLSHTALRAMGRLPVNQKDARFLSALLVGTVPAILLGVALEEMMDTLFRNPVLVAAVLIAGSVLFIYAEWMYQKSVPQNEIDTSKGLKIGLFQALALFPGMSRSGAAIAGGMLMGLSRKEAARFSFMLAVPLLLGAGVKKFIELIQGGETVLWTPLLLGAVFAFVTGLAAIHFMLKFVQRYTLWPFIWYRIILALFVLYVFAIA